MTKRKYLLLPFDFMSITESGQWGLGFIIGGTTYIHFLWWFVQIKRYPKTELDKEGKNG